MEIITRQLTQQELKKEIDFIPSFFRQNNQKKAILWYGWDSSVKEKDLYRDISIPINELEDYITKAVQKGVFILGKSEMGIVSPDKDFEFLICHESDIHFESENSDFIDDIKKAWQKKGIKFYKAKK